MVNNYVRFIFCLIIVPTLLLCGMACNRPLSPDTHTIAVTGRVPVIDLPDKPVLESLDPDELVAYNSLSESARKKLQNNDRKLKSYAAQMKVGIEDYNIYAALRNRTSEDTVGVKGK